MNFCLPILMLLLLVSATQSARAEADGPDYWQVYGVAADDVLNIRQAPNWKSPKIGEIPPDGQCLKNIMCVGGLTLEEFTNLSEAEKEKILQERPRWCYIEYRGIKGWVSGRYLREGFCQQASEPQPTEQP
jgi:hypothetical protein